MKLDTIELKPILKIKELVPYLKSKNIKFEIMSEKEAEEYLRKNNNYYNITAYKNNFSKYPSPAGKYEGLYQDLDFAYLKDLAIIDYRVRLLFFKITIDIEHYLKIRILNLIDNDLEDGYRIVNMYLEKDFYNEENPRKIHNSIFKKVGSDNYNKIFSDYYVDKDKKLENIPIWEFLEIITFGDLVRFYEFFIKEYKIEKEMTNVYILREIVKLRNAVAHNNCLLSDLNKKDNHNKPEFRIVNYLIDSGVRRDFRSNKLKNSRIRQMTYALYMFNEIVTSEGIKENVTKEINELFLERIIRHKEYYINNKLLITTYIYFKKIIDKNYNKNDKNSLT